MKGNAAPSMNRESWMVCVPRCALSVLIGAYMVAAQWNPADSTSVSSGSSLVLVILGLATGLLASVVNWKEYKSFSVDRFLLLATVAFLGWLGLATWFAKGHVNFRVSLFGFWQCVGLIGVLQGLVALFQSPRLHNKLLRWSIVLGAGTAVYALYQYLVSLPQTRQRFLIFKEEMLQDVGITVGTPEAMQFENRLFSTEPLGPFALTNSLAGTLAPIVALLGIVLVSVLWRSQHPILEQQGSDKSGQNREKDASVGFRWRFLGIGIAIFTLMSVVLLLTKSRTAWVATAVGLGIGFLILIKLSSRWSGRRIALGLVAGLVSVMTLIGLVAWLDSAILLEAGKSFLYRMEYWQGAWHLALRSPWFGYGPLAFQSEYTTVKSMTASENPADPHNMWMELLVCGGFPLLATSMMLTVWIVKRHAIIFFRGIQRYEPEGGDETNQVILRDADASRRDTFDDTSESTSRSEAALDVGGGIVLSLILFWGLIVYSVNPASDLAFHSMAFCLGAAVCYWLVRSWRFSRVGLWLASVLLSLVVVIHFFFSGGWMQPGAMSPLLIGLAGLICIRGGDDRTMVAGAETRSNVSAMVRTGEAQAGRKVAAVAFIFWGWIALLFGVFTLKPEMSRGPVEQMHMENRLAELSIQDCSELLAANGWDPDPASWLMRVAFQKLTDRNVGQSTRSKWLEFYGRARLQWIANDPRNWLVYSQVAIMDATVLEAGRSLKTDSNENLQMADMMGAMEQACQLNPSSAQCHLQHATLLYWNRQIEAARDALLAAEEIDRNTPHADRKIRVASIWVPSDLNRASGESLQAVSAANMPGFFKGEPVFSWLRKVLP